MAWPVRRNETAVHCNINVTPMVDVMLVLLIIFMVVLPIMNQPVPLEMAKVDHPKEMPDAGRNTAIVVAITRANHLYIGTDLTALPELGAKVQELLKSAAAIDQKVYVRADARANYGNVAEVVDALRAAGVDDLGLLTEKRTKTTPDPAQFETD